MEFIVIDIIIILLLVMGGIIGFKNGAIKEGTKFLGMFLIIVISFILKDKLMVSLYENLPFFDFFGVIRGFSALNILLYQLISFLFIFGVLVFLLSVLLVITGLIQWLVKMTIFLNLPSRILGAVVGVLEFYVYLFIILYVLNMPVLNLGFVEESNLGAFILEDTPILSGLVDDTVSAYKDVWEIISNRGAMSNKEINTLVLFTMLDNKLITIDSAKKLVETNKIIIEDSSILEEYNESESLFEKFGGCFITKNCQENDIITGVSIHGKNDYIRYGNLEITVNSVDDNPCILKGSCENNEKIKLEVTIKNTFSEKKYSLVSNGTYRKIEGTNQYMYAKIDDGHLVVNIVK